MSIKDLKEVAWILIYTIVNVICTLTLLYQNIISLLGSVLYSYCNIYLSFLYVEHQLGELQFSKCT